MRKPAVIAMIVALAMTTPPLAQDAPAAQPDLAALLAAGEPIYAARCKECHGSAGGGFVGPKLVGNDRIANAEFVLRRINTGAADMPAFASKLTPEDIVAVGTYIRNSWGNSYGVLAE